MLASPHGQRTRFRDATREFQAGFAQFLGGHRQLILLKIVLAWGLTYIHNLTQDRLALLKSREKLRAETRIPELDQKATDRPCQQELRKLDL